MTSTTSSITTSDGISLLTRHWTHPDPKARVLLVHGIGEHSGRWEHVGDFLVANGYEAFGFDHRGHGNSEGARVDVEYFEQYVDDLELVFDTLPKDRPRIIYGHSMGALVAVSLAVGERTQPSLYVFSAPALDAAAPAALKLAAKALARIRPKTALPNSIKGEQLSRDPAVGERYFADPLVHAKATARMGVALLGQMDAINLQLGQIETPALVIHGAEDVLVPPHASAPLAGISGVERKLFPGLRHEIHNEPEQNEVLGFVTSWLDNQLA